MITGHNDSLPKNKFGELDELERREHLDGYFGNNLREGSTFPVTAALPYNTMLAYPFMNTGFPPLAAPLWKSGEEDDS